MAYDFSKPEVQKLYREEVQKRIDQFGMSRDQAEMLVAALMMEPWKAQSEDVGPKST